MNAEMQSTLLALFITHIAPVLFSGLAMLLGWVFVALGKKLNAQATESKMAAVGSRMAHLAAAVVADLEVTLKPDLQRAVMDGKLTKAEIAQLRTVALKRLKEIAGEKGLHELQAVLQIATPQVDSYLTGVIEQAVDRLPKN